MSETLSCLDHAEACRDAAAHLNSPHDQAILLKIAREWQHAAIESATPADAPMMWPLASVVVDSSASR